MLPQVGEKITVKVIKISIGKDGKTYVTIVHEDATNRPTFVWKEDE